MSFDAPTICGDDGDQSSVVGRTVLWAIVLAAVACLCTGCGGDDETLLGAYLTGLEVDAPLDSAASTSLGDFDVPVATTVKGSGGSRTVWMRIRFELFAETQPENASAVTKAFERHRGALNDAVLTIVRSSSVDELTDPRAKRAAAADRRGRPAAVGRRPGAAARALQTHD